MIEIPRSTTGPHKGCIPVPIKISNLGNKRITSARFDIHFNSDVLEFDHLSQQGTVVENWMVSRNPENGMIKIALAGSTPISNTGGILLYIYFNVLGKNGDYSVIECKDCTLNGNEKIINIVNGAFQVCNGFELSGKITYHSSDLPIEKVILKITSPDGKKLLDPTMTDVNGNFHFKGIPWGQLRITPEYHDLGDAAITTNDAASIYKIINASDQTINGYQLIAADVIGDNLISDDDIVEINEYCVGNPTRFQRVATQV